MYSQPKRRGLLHGALSRRFTRRLDGLFDLWISTLLWNPKPVELLLGALMLSRAYLLLPWASFKLSPSLYALMAFLPEELWGAIGLVLGAASLTATLGDRLDQRHLLRCFLAALMALHSMLISGLFWIAEPRSPAGLDRGIIAWGAVWVVVNLYSRHAVWKDRADRCRSDGCQAGAAAGSCALFCRAKFLGKFGGASLGGEPCSRSKR